MTLYHRTLRTGLLAGLTLALIGCASMDTNVARLEADVQSISVGEPHAVSARDLAAAMVQAGFSGADILKYGPEVRNAIGSAGGAQINKDKFAHAILTVQDGKLYVSSRDGGTFLREL